jgi:hypothetical protein
VNGLALLLADTDGASTAAGSLGVLTTDTQTPVVTQTTVGADLLQALEILTQLAVQTVGQNLGVLAVDDVALSVEEPGGDLVLGGVLEDGDDTLEFFGGELTSAVQVIKSACAIVTGEMSSIEAFCPFPLCLSPPCNNHRLVDL